MGGRTWRSAVVLALVAALALLPLVIRALPAGSPGEGAAALLARVRGSLDSPYSGYAESTGSLALPMSSDLGDVASLLGGRTQVRVWWRSSGDWRADTLTPTGEVGARTTPSGSTVWSYENDRVLLTTPDPAGAVRLPTAGDLLPPRLAARLLSGAGPELVTSLPSRRVAGRRADGLRLTPREPLSSVERVDVWADRESGVPVAVDVFGTDLGAPAVSSTFLDFSDATPTAAATAFTPPPGARVRTRQRFDLVRAVGRFPDQGLPPRLLGFDRATPLPDLEGIARYGRGVTQFAVGALPVGTADSLRRQLHLAAGARPVPEGVAVTVGPIGLLLTDPAVTGRSWLVTGTLTADGLARVAAALPRSTA
ncbi:MAG: hypothetical protein ABIS35_07790 [Terracoccus sp.]